MGVLFSRLPTVPDARSAVARLTARQAGPQAAPQSDDAAAVDADDLVARALEILADETDAWQARAAATGPSGRAR